MPYHRFSHICHAIHAQLLETLMNNLVKVTIIESKLLCKHYFISFKTAQLHTELQRQAIIGVLLDTVTLNCSTLTRIS